MKKLSHLSYPELCNSILAGQFNLLTHLQIRSVSEQKPTEEKTM